MDAQLHPFVVVISHCHPDHIGGCTDSSGRLLYSNARFVLAQDEWDFWTSESNLAMLDDFFADAVLHPIHIERPEWIAVVDMDPEQLVATRHRILERIAAEKAKAIFHHFDFPALGTVSHSGTNWRWQPMARRNIRKEGMS